MRRAGTIFLVAMALLVVPCSVMAERNASLYGMGNDSCGQLTEAFSKNSFTQSVKSDGVQWPSKSRAYVEWTLGFITAFNMVNSQGKNLEDTDLYGIAAWLQKWCADHPIDAVSSAAWALVTEHSGYKPMLDKDKQE